MLTQLINTYNEAIREQANERMTEMTPFRESISETVFNAGLLAIEDFQRDQARYRVVAASTGSGKSSYAQAFIKAYISAVPNGSALFLVETVAQAEATYLSMSSLIGNGKVAVWTNTHDKNAESRQLTDSISNVSQTFSLDELENYPVVIATHNFFKGVRGDNVMQYGSSRRHLIFIDERPNDVDVYDVDTGLIKTVRDMLAERHSASLELVTHLTSLHDFLETQWQRAISKLQYDELPSTGINLDWFTSEQAYAFASSFDDRIRTVFGFARALNNGQAFMSRYDGYGSGARFVGYERTMPLMPGMVVLDATATIDGISQLDDCRDFVRVPPVNFRDLDLTHVPHEARFTNMKDLKLSRSDAKDYAAWIRNTVIKNSQPGEKLLVVAHKFLFQKDYLPKDCESLTTAFKLDGRDVCFINWGQGVGSNEWRDVSAVFLFGDFYMPKRSLIATYLGIKGLKATGEALSSFQSPNPYLEAIQTLQDGQICRQIKQLAMRGNARNIRDDGYCGHQRLYLTGDLQRLIRHKDRMFPGANMTIQTSETRLLEGGTQALASLLYDPSRTELTTVELHQLTGISFQKNKMRYLTNPIIEKAMEDTGFAFKAGGGRGNPGRFIRQNKTPLAA